MSDQNECMVSVYCSTYNHKNYLLQCLDSLVSQKTSFRYEIIVKDDASTDGTTDIVRAYHKKYPDLIVPLILSENHYQRGLALVAFEKAFRLMKGKYVAMCEGDDFWTDENKLQKQVDFMESHTEYSLCGHASFYADENGDLIKGDSFRPRVGSCDLTVEEIINSWSMPTCSLLYRKSCRTDVIIPFQGNCINGDYAQMVYFALKGKTRYMDQMMGAYRLFSSGSVSQKIRNDPELFRKNRMEYLAMLDRIDDYTHHCYSQIIDKRKRRICFEMYLQFGEGQHLKEYRDVCQTVPFKTKIKYVLCVYFNPVYCRIKNIRNHTEKDRMES